MSVLPSGGVGTIDWGAWAKTKDVWLKMKKSTNKISAWNKVKFLDGFILRFYFSPAVICSLNLLIAVLALTPPVTDFTMSENAASTWD